MAIPARCLLLPGLLAGIHPADGARELTRPDEVRERRAETQGRSSSSSKSSKSSSSSSSTSTDDPPVKTSSFRTDDEAVFYVSGC